MGKFTLAKLALACSFIYACSDKESTPKNNTLPYIGQHTYTDTIINGKQTVDTTLFKIPPFSLLNQDSVVVNNTTFAGKVYVSDFFFTSCPTICPTIKVNQQLIAEHFKDNKNVKIVSHTIDFRNDSIPKLKSYGEKLGVDFDQWQFLYGHKDVIYPLANHYMNVALENPAAPGGFDHGVYIVLVDKDGHLRAYCNGTEKESVLKFIKDIEKLLAE